MLDPILKNPVIWLLAGLMCAGPIAAQPGLGLESCHLPQVAGLYAGGRMLTRERIIFGQSD